MALRRLSQGHIAAVAAAAALTFQPAGLAQDAGVAVPVGRLGAAQVIPPASGHAEGPGTHLVQLLIPGDTFHTARVIGTRQWFLGASTEWPGVVPADVELGDAEKLVAEFPAVAADVRAFPVAIKI